MKNKKGFTLIELLAVIVVLAIIALIATPIVMNTIKNAKKEAAERTSSWTKLDEDQITLPSGQQIATASGDTKWNTSTDGNGFKSETWLYSHMKFTTGTYCYWTSSPKVSSTDFAWGVYYDGTLSNVPTYNTSTCSIRPVITISKANLS